MSPVVLPVKTPSVQHEHASTSSASQPVAGQHTSPTPGTDNAHSASLFPSIPGRIDQAVVNALSSVKLEGCLPHLAKAEILTIEDLAGDGDHYAATVVSEAFRGRSRVQQHQMIYAALRGRMGGELHALALQTSAPE